MKGEQLKLNFDKEVIKLNTPSLRKRRKDYNPDKLEIIENLPPKDDAIEDTEEVKAYKKLILKKMNENWDKQEKKKDIN